MAQRKKAFDEPAQHEQAFPLLHGGTYNLLSCVGQWSNVDFYIAAPSSWRTNLVSFQAYILKDGAKIKIGQTVSIDQTKYTDDGNNVVTQIISVRGHPCDGFLLEGVFGEFTNYGEGRIKAVTWGTESTPEVVGRAIGDIEVNPIVPSRASFLLAWDATSSVWSRVKLDHTSGFIGVTVENASIPVTNSADSYWTIGGTGITPAGGTGLSTCAFAFGWSSTAAEWDPIRQGNSDIVTNPIGMLNTMPAGHYETAPSVLTNGQWTQVRLMSDGSQKMSEQLIPAAEDNTNAVIAIAQAPLATSTYSRTLATVYATKSKIVKASAGNLFSLYARNVNGAVRYLQVFNSVSLPADTTVPIFSFAMAASTGQVDPAFVASLLGPMGYFFSTGITCAISTTEATLTVAADGDLSTLHVTYK